MTVTLRGLALAATLSLALIPAGFAQDAMATDAMAVDAMAPAAMAPISDAELATCLEQAKALTFPEVAFAAVTACHGLHQGMDVMGAIRAMTDVGESDAMATDAMAPATK